MENGPISRESQFGVTMVRDIWWKAFTEKVSLEFRVKEWRTEKVVKRNMEWDKHKEVKLVHEVKEEFGSRGEARHTERHLHQLLQTDTLMCQNQNHHSKTKSKIKIKNKTKSRKLQRPIY